MSYANHFNCASCGTTAEVILKDGYPTENPTSRDGIGEYVNTGFCSECAEEVTCCQCNTSFKPEHKNFTVLDPYGDSEIVCIDCFDGVQMCIPCEEVYRKEHMVEVTDGGEPFQVCEMCAESYD